MNCACLVIKVNDNKSKAQPTLKFGLVLLKLSQFSDLLFSGIKTTLSLLLFLG